MNYRLLSTGLIHTPGIVAWAKNAYHFPRDRTAIAVSVATRADFVTYQSEND